MISSKIKLLFLVVAAALVSAVAAGTIEATIDEHGNVDVGAEALQAEKDYIDASIPLDEQLAITVTNQSPYRVDLYYDDGEYGSFISTLDKNEQTGINSYVGHTFFVTRHGMKQGLFVNGERLLFNVGQRDQAFLVPSDASPSSNPCQDRFSICKKQA